jgi:DNA mismatch repair protein MutL
MVATTPPNNVQTRPVRRLSPDLARKIAAGEVIDRPNAIIRELLDNAVDAGATSITVEIDGGGIDRIRVVDNGGGMTKTDLENAAQPHATSKIAEEADLLNISTLGFRGEALASIAAVSRLTIASARAGEAAWELKAGLTGHTIVPANLVSGTIVMSEALFENIPARRYFLKRPASEGALCRQTFVEKVFPRTDIAFKLIMDGKQKLNLPEGQSLAERFVSAFEPDIDSRLLYEIHVEDTERLGDESRWKGTILIGEPSVFRADKKYLFVYVNGHCITEFALLQAIEYGAQGYFPNGTHPVAALFLDIAPNLVDFNIHPAKREARFRDLPPIHHAVSTAVRNFFKQQNLAEQIRQTKAVSGDSSRTSDFSPPEFDLPKSDYRQPSKTSGHAENYAGGYASGRDKGYSPSTSTAAKLAELASVAESEPIYMERTHDFKYMGTAFGVFLLVEKGDSLYMIDQHAAHERILYNRFIARAGEKQPLLIPYVLETQDAQDDAYLESIFGALKSAGFDAENCGDGRWEFSAVPLCWQGSEMDLRQDLLEKRLSPAEIVTALAAITACRAAIKEGTVLDDTTAIDIIEETFALETTRCPHGRPLWFTISRDELYQRVRRTE